MSQSDPFSKMSPAYARYRPRYPDALFIYLVSVVPGRTLAWDCGTGSGQAALALVPHFDRIVATDASEEQLTQAASHEKITYRASPAERSGLPARSVDLVTTAMALHWFDLDAFYAEVQRVLAPRGVLAAWTYHLSRISPEVDAAVSRYYRDVLGSYWSPRLEWVEDGYRSLPFPFLELDPPRLEMEASWDLAELRGYLSTWSAAQDYREVKGRDPLEDVDDELSAAWGADQIKRRVRWPIQMRIGREQP
ncbi:MAG: class I SAM-dependent methyltransferase [Anaerolineae bacterium]